MKGVRIVIVSCTTMYLSTIMSQAKELMMLEGWAWIATVSILFIVFILIHFKTRTCYRYLAFLTQSVNCQISCY